MSQDTNPTPTILVVDDNEANRALARSTLEDEGYRVVLANDGRAAIEAFARETPACVIMDVRMPDIDGFAACEQIRALPLGAETPIIFLTALRDVDTFDRALAVGGDDFLTKPVRPPELVARVQTALKLRQLRVELRDQYDLLRHQRDDLLRVQLQKERLTAFVVHDLKTPVSTVDLFAQLLLSDAKISDQSRGTAMQIRYAAGQLNRMILNLLDLSKGDEGKLQAKRSDVDLSALVREVLSELGIIAEQRKVHLGSSLGSEHVTADPDLLRRLLTNLVENALRYAPTGTKVEVAAITSAAAVELRIADQGPGIPAALRERIFDPYVQAEGAGGSGGRGGRGLGLAFCKLAVDAHRGRIWIEDAAPGAVFCVRIPHAPDA